MLEFEERYGPPDIARRISDVGQRIAHDYPDGQLLLIAVLKGAGIFMADLARTIPGPLRLEYIDVIKGGNEEEIMDIQFLASFPVKGMDLIVLKDVIRSGVIETWLMTQLREQGPRSIRFASLVDRPQERKSSLYVDYVLFPSEEGILVGYGMEYKGEGGNLPFIAQVRTPGDSPFGSSSSST
jgi:hypoxanthine phosphoribosyltransferase